MIALDFIKFLAPKTKWKNSPKSNPNGSDYYGHW